MTLPVVIAAPPMVQDITVPRGAGGDVAAVAITLPAPLAAGDVVRLEIHHGMKLVLCRRTDARDLTFALAVDGGNLVTWWPTPEETRAIRAGRVDRYAFDLFRPGTSLGPLLSGFLIGLDA